MDGVDGVDGVEGGDGPTPSMEEWPDVFDEEIRRAEQRIRSFIEQHPVAALAGAAAIGFVIARVLRED